MPKVKGFTFLELMITLSIVAIITTIALPSFAEIIADNRQVTRYNQLLTAIALTRSEAIKRGERVSLCQSSSGISCTKDSDLWHQGWVVYTDRDEDNHIDKDEEILLIQNTLSEDITISFGSRTRVAYHPEGLAVGGSNGTFLLCDYRADRGKKGLVIFITGRTRLATKEDLEDNTCPN